MCGIVGIFDREAERDIDAELLYRMNETQFHRGPNEGGVHIEPGVGLGHRRLSIIDLANGRQPLFNEDGSVAVVYNGEIYNFQDLARELAERGHRFRTHCDTEVIVHAWEEWGRKCVHRFRGMFAFAIWDRSRQSLFLARDRLGIKPLYYADLPDGRFVFSSELKALLACPDLPRQLDPHAVEDYFALGYVPDPKSILRSTHKLAPGHTLTVNRRGQRAAPEQYWDVPFLQGGSASEGEVQDELVARLREAVGIRLIADVPLGAFLSGGVDSSAVVATMAGLSPNAPVTTCSISFGEPRYNESEHAAAVAQRYGTDHYVEQVDHDDFGLLDKLSALYDEPYADSSAIPTYRVCELARKKVTVALSGDGGDENFAGYRRHRWHMLEERFRARVPPAVRGALFGFLGRCYPKLDWAPKVLRAKSTFQAIARDSVSAYLHSVSVAPDDLRRRLFSKSFHQQLGGYRAVDLFNHHVRNAPTDDPLSLIQYIDMKTYLPGDILTKVDRASMAHALEVRVPILDHEFVEWASGLAPDLKLRGREGKWIFKRALEPMLPRDILYRPKMGFGVPLASWFRGPLRDRVRGAVLGDTLQDTGLFDHRTLERLVKEHQSGVREHSAVLWSLLMFEAFARRILDGRAPAS